MVELYTEMEARMVGFRPATVLGKPFFHAVARCMNNVMVVQRFEDETDLYEIVP